MTFQDHNASHTGIAQKSEPEKDLHMLEFLGPSQICFVFQKCHWCHTGRKSYELFYEMIMYNIYIDIMFTVAGEKLQQIKNWKDKVASIDITHVYIRGSGTKKPTTFYKNATYPQEKSDIWFCDRNNILTPPPPQDQVSTYDPQKFIQPSSW